VELKETLLMPKTDFPMRGGLPTKEPVMQQGWYDGNLYAKVNEKNKDKMPFILLDGPPYANGNIHMGHALNKILKDFIVRCKSMSGFYAPYIPGWDTHGLPIEQALVNKKKVKRKEKTTAEFRDLCQEYALEQIAMQKEQFKRLGVLGEWDNPYITLNKEFEAEQLLVFAKMAKDGLVYKGLRPIYWSPSSETALAEAEIEYQDKQSASVFIAFKVADGKGILAGDEEFVIWTTTPWTIPANLAICLNAELEYAVIAVNGRKFIVAKELVESLSATLEWNGVEILSTSLGSKLEGITAKHPFYDRDSLVILGEHVTLDAGTGLVHTAPGHGEDDFYIGKKYGLDVLCPVDGRGVFTSEAPGFEGVFYDDANKEITAKLEETGALLKLEFIKHSYPHDWRTKKPIIFRTTSQWFASIEALKEDILSEIEKVKWTPIWGETRIANMFKDRGEWCISRQRVWGVPIPAFYAEDGTVILDEEIIKHVAIIVKEKGSNAWFELDAKDLLPAGFSHPGSPNGVFVKETDIMDVWFDSGVVHHGVLKPRDLPYPADLFLEGSDQYRGWFNSSLTTGVAMTGKAPYKSVLSHGFVLDGKGLKMSKSLGNVIDPLKLIKNYGADVIRLWVASVDYQSDVRISEDMIKQVSESYRKIRNTFRFLLGNLNDFNPSANLMKYEDLHEVDQLMMVKLGDLVKDVRKAYDEYRFDDVFKLMNNYIINDLSSFYLDFTKDILYIEAQNDSTRRSVQSVFYHHAMSIVKLLAPIIPHTAEEIYSHIPGEKLEAVYLEDMPEVVTYADTENLVVNWQRVNATRENLLKALEEARANKVIGKSMEAKATLYVDSETLETLNTVNADLRQIFILSELEITSEAPQEGAKAYDDVHVLIEKRNGHTCARCWQVVDNVNEVEVCPRCADVIVLLKD